MKATFYTLGCKVNQNETAALEGLFRAAGYTIVPADETADVYVVNSCTVTTGGDAKSRQWLRRARRQNPGAVTVLCGCYPQAFPQQAALPQADIVAGTTQRAKLVQLVEQFLQNRQPLVQVIPHQKNEAFEELPGAPMPNRTRAFVKIQDGCNRRCAYCIIPTARGPSRSRSQPAILQELHSLAATGHAEAVLTGINLPSYGMDTGTDLAALVAAAEAVPGLRRLRLSSLEPDLITPEQIERFAASPILCRHFHLSLQSGCAATLRRMRRPYTPAQFAAAATALRAAMPGASLTTDVIVGFPGEDEAEFEENLAFVVSMAFLKVHVFPFSARPGTPAATMPGQVPKQEKARRVAAMQKAADTVRAEWIAQQAGTRQQVLLETPLPNGLHTGYTQNYIPVQLAAPGATQGDVIPIQLGTFNGEYCGAQPV